jgi:hypothetical protein
MTPFVHIATQSTATKLDLVSTELFVLLQLRGA